MPDPAKLELVPGVYDALSALIAVCAGHGTLFVAGSALSAALLGRPDIGLLTATELAESVARIRDRVDASLIVDADSGYGSIHNLARTVRLLERSGANVVQIEDQLALKPQDQPLSRAVDSCETMIDRIKAAVDARVHRTTRISARTDAAPALGLEAAIERINLYDEAGADLLFVQSLRTQAEAEHVAGRLDRTLPLVIHLPDDPAKADFEPARLAEIGFAYGLLPSLLISAAAAAIAQRLGPGHGTPGSFDLQQALWSR